MCRRGSGGRGSDKRKGQAAKELTLSFRTWNQFPTIERRFLKVGEYQWMLGPLVLMPFITYFIKVYCGPKEEIATLSSWKPAANTDASAWAHSLPFGTTGAPALLLEAKTFMIQGPAPAGSGLVFSSTHWITTALLWLSFTEAEASKLDGFPPQVHSTVSREALNTIQKLLFMLFSPFLIDCLES
jgi:hypothetical protein